MSSHPADRYRFLQHLAALTLAWVVASLLFLHALRPITVAQPGPYYHVDAIGKGETAVQNILYLSSALRGGKTLVIVGSSELDAAHAGRYSPDAFFPEHRLARVFTYGQAGFDTLGMYGLLYAVRPHLSSRSRLTIILSPEWFRRTDLRVTSFNDNFNDTVLLQDYWSDEARSIFHDYLVMHQFEFSNMTATQRLFMDDPSSIFDWRLPGFIARTVNARAYAQRIKLDLYLSRLTQPEVAQSYDAGNGKDLPWDRYEADARNRELQHMAHNDLWVRDKFYRRYLSDGGLRHRRYFPAAMSPEPEMAALRELLQMLQRSKVKALFIMQPINPKLYDDVHGFDEVDARVTSLCREYGMGYYDMYGEVYEPGTLRDGVHPGELGWEHIDQHMAEYFHL